MKIAIDATELAGRPTGVGRYLGNLLSQWIGDDEGNEFILLSSAPLPEWLSRAQNCSLRPRSPFRNGLLDQQVGLAKALSRVRPDVLFAPAYSLPLAYRGPSVLTVHDISFAVHPEWFSWREGLKRRLITRWSARRASHTITVSNFIREELLEHYALDPDRVMTIPHGIEPSWRSAPSESDTELRQRLGFSGDYVLMVGSLFERRFPLETIAAFSQLGDLDLRLVIAGEDRRHRGAPLEEEIRKRGLSERIIWLSYTNDETLRALYRNASQLIYLSAYEGFGLPPLEGMLFDIPAIVSGRGALAEIYGETAVTIPNEAPETIAAAIRMLATDQHTANHYREKGRRLAEALNLETCARKTLDLLVETGERQRRIDEAG